MTKRRALLGLLVALVAIQGALLSCGTQGDIIGGVTAWPNTGIKPWSKIDADPNTSGLQPFIFESDGDYDYVEPNIVKAHGWFWVFFERRHYQMRDGIKVPTNSDILAGRATDALSYEWVNDGKPILTADLDWEGGYVGAPAVLPTDDGLVMWYAGGIGAGIGVATSDDGVNWTKDQAPVLIGDQAWEDGFVGAPGVLEHGGKFRLYYSGGMSDADPFSQFAGRFIGYADSTDGRHWIKRDAHGRNSRDDGDGVFYVLGPTQDWQNSLGENDTGVVASPSPMLLKPVDRELLLVYYTGNPYGLPIDAETSIGVAGAYDDLVGIEDGEEFITNPVLSERFALTLEGVSEFMAYSESGASVIRMEYDQYFMVFSETDPLSELTGGHQGIAMAACPRYP